MYGKRFLNAFIVLTNHETVTTTATVWAWQLQNKLSITTTAALMLAAIWAIPPLRLQYNWGFLYSVRRLGFAVTKGLLITLSYMLLPALVMLSNPSVSFADSSLYSREPILTHFFKRSLYSREPVLTHCLKRYFHSREPILTHCFKRYFHSRESVLTHCFKRYIHSREPV